MTFYYVTQPDIGFYNDSFNPIIPEGAKEISDEQHAFLIKGQSDGKQISINADGSLYLTDKPSAPVSNNNIISPLVFMGLFTDTENNAIAVLAQNNVSMFRWYMKTVAATYIDLSSEETVSGMQTLVNLGVIDLSRMNTIIAGN